MSKLGMNAEVISSLSGKLDSGAAQLRGVMASVDSLVSKAATVWQGNDSRDFASWWNSQHKPAMLRAVESIEGLARAAQHNVSEQTGVSGDASGHSGGPTVAAAAPVAAAPSPSESRAAAGPNGSQDYSAHRSIDLARAEVGTARPTGWNAEGECIKSVQRWVNEAGGHFGGGGVTSGYVNSGATGVDMSQVRAGDVLQYTSQSSPDSFNGPVHTVLVAGVNADGSYDIIQSNSPAGSGRVSEIASWMPKSTTTGWEWKAWRFAGKP